MNKDNKQYTIMKRNKINQHNMRVMCNIWRELFLYIALGLMAVIPAHANTYYSIATGNWSNSAVWSLASGGAACGSIPGTSDSVVIQGGFTITVDATYTCSRLQIGSTSNGILTFGSAQTLTVNGAVNLNSGSTLNMNTGWLNLTGSLSVLGTLSIGSSTIVFKGNSQQSISGLTSITFYSMVLDNAAGVIVNKPTTTLLLASASPLNLINGNLNLNGANLTIGNNSINGIVSRTNGTISNVATLRADKAAYFYVQFPAGTFNGNTINSINVPSSNCHIDFLSAGGTGETISIGFLTGAGFIQCDHLTLLGSTNATNGQVMMYFNYLGTNVKNTLTLGNGNNLSLAIEKGFTVDNLVVNVGTGTATLGNSTHAGGTFQIKNSITLTSGILNSGTNASALILDAGISINRINGSMNVTTAVYTYNNRIAVSYTGSSNQTIGDEIKSKSSIASLTINLTDTGKTISTRADSALTISGNLVMNGGTLSLSHDLRVGGSISLQGGTLTQNANTFYFDGTMLNRGNGRLIGYPTISSSNYSVCYTGSTDLNLTPELYPLGGTLSNLTLNMSNSTRVVQPENMLLPQGNVTVYSGVLQLNHVCRIQSGKVVTIGSSGVVNSNGYLVLSNTALGSASIGNSSGAVNGRVVMEDYYAGGRRACRMMSHPFSEAMTLDSLIDDIHITGAGGAINGFDPTATNDASSYGFNEAVFNGGTNSGWLTHDSTHDTIGRCGVVRLYYRGPRSQGNLLDGSKPIPNAGTLDWSGTINQGTITVALSYTASNGSNAGWNLIGNPYPSAINIGTMCAADRNNISGFSVWVPGNGGRGSFVTYSFGTDYILPVGGAFFVQTNTAGSLIFRESMKVNEAATHVLHKTGASGEGIVLELWSDDTIWWDRWELKKTAGAGTQMEATDFRKLVNPDVNLYSQSTDNNQLSIDSREGFQTAEVVKLGMKSSSAYHFTLKVKSMELLGSTPVLIDHFLNTQTPLVAGATYDFVTTTDSLSAGDGRFEIRFDKAVSGVNEQDVNNATFTVYPNPVANGKVFIQSRKNITEPVKYKLSKVSGETVASGNMNVTDGLDVEALQSGIYMLSIEINGILEHQKIIITQ